MLWHSLDENGKIEIYDIQWSDGTVETNIPVGLLESVREGAHNEGEDHGVQEKDTPVNERKYKGNKMKILKSQLRRIIKEAMPAGGVPDVVGAVSGVTGEERRQLMDSLQKEWGLKHVKTTEEFDGTPGGIWLSGEEGATAPPWVQDGEDLPIFDYYMDVDPYVFGVHPEFEAFVVDKFGFAPEWNDPGTLMLWPL